MALGPYPMEAFFGWSTKAVSLCEHASAQSSIRISWNISSVLSSSKILHKPTSGFKYPYISTMRSISILPAITRDRQRASFAFGIFGEAFICLFLVIHITGNLLRGFSSSVLGIPTFGILIITSYYKIVYNILELFTKFLKQVIFVENCGRFWLFGPANAKLKIFMSLLFKNSVQI